MKQASLVHGFIVEATTPLPEIKSTGVSLRHQKTGLKVFHITNDDTENAFAFAFRTPPASSNGVAHILEHSVLCGSEAFPLKDPFGTLMKGSMSTYLNAWTYPDKTVYPAASINRADYFNILSVYGDAVFFPLLRRETFLQEAHRLEPRDPENPDSPLAANGVVFSEMKGNYSSQSEIVADATLRALFPDTPYGVDSGGEPTAILGLSWETLKAFHRSYYHPSNCRVLLYGDIPTEEQLEFLERRFLSRFEPLAVASSLPLQAAWETPRRLDKTYPVRPGEDLAHKTEVTVAWLLGDVTDSARRTEFQALAEILAGHAGSPLRRALVESGLGQDYSSVAGLETELRQMTFTTGLRGAETADSEKIEALALASLVKLARDGIPQAQIEAALDRMEFRAREISSGHTPYPLRLFSRALRGWLHEAPPEETLLLLPPLQDLRRRLESEPRRLESLIEEHLVKNRHRSLVVTDPDPGFMEKFEVRIEAAIKRSAEGLDAEQRAALKQEWKRLQAFQEESDPPAVRKTIPFLKRSDLPAVVSRIGTESGTLANNIPLLSTPLFTGGIVYADIAFRVDGLPERLLPWLPLFGQAVCGGGLPGKGYAEVQQELSLLSGGFQASTDASWNASAAEAPAFLMFRLKALAAKFPAALALAGELVRAADFSDANRLRHILLEEHNGLAAGVIPSGSYFARLHAGRNLSRDLELMEIWNGIEQLDFLSAARTRSEKDAAGLSGPLEEIRSFLLFHAPLLCSLTAGPEDLERARSALAGFAAAFANPAGAPQGSTSALGRARLPAGTPRLAAGEALVAATSVGFAASVFRSAPFGSRENVIETALGHLLSTGALHEEVRVRGGAYGASAAPYRQAGVFFFSSYRDPRLAHTLDAFASSLAAVERGAFPPDDLEKAIIATVAKAEAPLRPGEKGYVAFSRKLLGITDELRQRNRDWLLEVEAADIKRRAGALRALLPGAQTVVLTGKEAWESVKKENPEWRFKETELSL